MHLISSAVWVIDTTGRSYPRDNILDFHGDIDANRSPRTAGNDTDIKKVTMKSALYIRIEGKK